MALVTLLELRTRVRERADMVYSQFVSDAELNRYINESAQELYDLLVQANVDYYSTLESFTIAPSANTHTLPDDFYKIRTLDIDLGGRFCPVWPYNVQERGYWQDAVISRIAAPVLYRVVGGTLELVPSLSAAGSYRLTYVPLLEPMVDDTDEFNGFNGFETYIIVDAAIKAKDKEESSVTVLTKQKDELMKRIEAMANVVDYGANSSIANVRDGLGYNDIY